MLNWRLSSRWSGRVSISGAWGFRFWAVLLVVGLLTVFCVLFLLVLNRELGVIG